MFKMEAVTVCVGYHDFLAETLPHNIQHFDRFVVVTSFGDKDTQRVCHRFGVECRLTDVMHVGGEPFNKGRAVDYGLGFLRRDSWIVHLDADIFLPPTTRYWIEQARPDPECIYGIDRVNCVGYESWRKYIDNHGGRHQWHHHCIIAPPPFPMGARISLRDHAGYVPIGYFQLFHGKHGRRYPVHQGDAEHTDVLHALQWPTDNRRLMPEIICVHLESEPARMGVNWKGRKTKPFGLQPDQGSVSNGCNLRPAYRCRSSAMQAEAIAGDA